MAVKNASSTTMADAETKAAEKTAAQAKPTAAATEEKTAAKAIETKKDTTKKLETKAAVLVENSAEEKKPAAKKTTAAKTTTRKTTRRTTTKKAELKVETYLQFDGKEFTDKELLQRVKEYWTKTLKNKVGDMKDVKIYLKPQESAAYFVINNDTTGKLSL